MNRSIRILLASALLLAVQVPAQQILVVDKQGGAGSQFTEIQPAINSAAPGDIILVRPGRYRGFRIRKALSLVGDPGVTVDSSMHVEALSAGEVVVLKGINQVNPGYYGGGLTIQNNAGAVHCEDIQPEGGVTIFSSRQVSMHRCDMEVASVQSSDVVFTASSSTGFAGGYGYIRIPALVVFSGRVTLAGGTWAGAVGYQGLRRGAHAIELQSGRLLITGDFTTVIRAGTGGSVTASAIQVQGGELIVDPDPQLLPVGGAQAISGAGQVTVARTPFLTTDVQSRTLVTTLNTGVGATAYLIVSPLGPPVALPSPLADLWVAVPVVLLSSTVRSALHHDRVPLPPLPPGTSIAVQYLVVDGPNFALSNPDVKVLAP